MKLLEFALLTVPIPHSSASQEVLAEEKEIGDVDNIQVHCSFISLFFITSNAMMVYPVESQFVSCIGRPTTTKSFQDVPLPATSLWALRSSCR